MKNCLKCKTEFKQKHKYHLFCSKKCTASNYFSKERIYTEKVMTIKVKPKSDIFDWRDYPYGV